MGTFLNSPQVVTNEVDLTTSVVAPATGIGAIAGPFTWGPMNEVVTVGNEVELERRFGRPNNDTATTFFSAANFLSYNGNLKVVRVGASGALNATTGATGFLVENETDYITNHSMGTAGVTWFAKWPGARGNALAVSVCDREKFSIWSFRGLFGAAPGTSFFASQTNPNANDEVHIVVYDITGGITGSAGTVLEKFEFLSKALNAKTESGENNYYVDVINRKSQWIWWGNHPGATAPGTAWGSVVAGATGFATFGATGPIFQNMARGVDANVLSSSHEILGYDLYRPTNVAVDVIISGDSKPATVLNLITLAEQRKDLVVAVSPERSDVVNMPTALTEVVAYRNTLGSSTYVFMDSGWKYQYDKYNDVFRWVPLNGDTAGLIARVDPWVSPAGLNRGNVRNVFRLAYDPSPADRDALYPAGINPVYNFEGHGVVLFGDKTMTSKPSAFGHINVRRLFILMRRAVSRTANFTLFELNTAFTRARFVSAVEPFLRDLLGRQAITRFAVVCDETNNTPQIINSNMFVGDVYVVPARSINFIRLNFIAVPEGISFNEIIGTGIQF